MDELRLIDANDIVKVADHAYNEWNLAMAAADGQREINLCFKRQELCKAVRAVAENAPTIDPETLPIVKKLRAELAKRPPVVHAHWKYITDIDGRVTSVCTHCEKTRWGKAKSHYCPNCGAIMDEEVTSKQ